MNAPDKTVEVSQAARELLAKSFEQSHLPDAAAAVRRGRVAGKGTPLWMDEALRAIEAALQLTDREAAGWKAFEWFIADVEFGLSCNTSPVECLAAIRKIIKPTRAAIATSALQSTTRATQPEAALREALPADAVIITTGSSNHGCCVEIKLPGGGRHAEASALAAVLRAALKDHRHG